MVFFKIKIGLIMSLKSVLFLALLFCSACSSQSELIKPEGEWRKINAVNPVTNKYVDAETEVKNGKGN